MCVLDMFGQCTMKAYYCYDSKLYYVYYIMLLHLKMIHNTNTSNSNKAQKYFVT